MTRISISICPTALQYDNGDTYDSDKLLDAIRLFTLTRHPGATITTLQIGQRQGDEWAMVDGDDEEGADLLAEFFDAHGTDDELFVYDDDEALAAAGLVCDRNIEEDLSGGQGHNWKLVRGDELPPSIREEIEAEIMDGKRDSTDDYMASNGVHYRW